MGPEARAIMRRWFPLAHDLQKASAWKRISAFLFDVIILSVVTVLFAWGLSALVGYNGYHRTLMARYDAFSSEYGVDFSITRAEYDALEDKDRQRVDEAWQAVAEDDTAAGAYRMILSLSVVIVSLSILSGYMVTEFFVPLKLKNGMTLGKKIFGLGVMGTDGVRLRGPALFIRTVLGKYTVETMIPVLILVMIYWGVIGVVGPVMILLILVGEAAAAVSTRRDGFRLIHDLMAGTVVVDFASQRIFESPEEKNAFLMREAAERARTQEY